MDRAVGHAPVDGTIDRLRGPGRHHQGRRVRAIGPGEQHVTDRGVLPLGDPAWAGHQAVDVVLELPALRPARSVVQGVELGLEASGPRLQPLDTAHRPGT